MSDKAFIGVALQTSDGIGCLVVRDAASKKWMLPGGLVNKGESHKDGAVRELKEETGLDLALDKMDLKYAVFSEKIDVSFFVTTTSLKMSQSIFDKRKHKHETDRFGIAVKTKEGRFKVLPDNSTTFRGGSPSHLNFFFTNVDSVLSRTALGFLKKWKKCYDSKMSEIKKSFRQNKKEGHWAWYMLPTQKPGHNDKEKLFCAEILMQHVLRLNCKQDSKEGLFLKDWATRLKSVLNNERFWSSVDLGRLSIFKEVWQTQLAMWRSTSKSDYTKVGNYFEQVFEDKKLPPLTNYVDQARYDVTSFVTEPNTLVYKDPSLEDHAVIQVFDDPTSITVLTSTFVDPAVLFLTAILNSQFVYIKKNPTITESVSSGGGGAAPNSSASQFLGNWFLHFNKNKTNIFEAMKQNPPKKRGVDNWAWAMFPTTKAPKEDPSFFCSESLALDVLNMPVPKGSDLEYFLKTWSMFTKALYHVHNFWPQKDLITKTYFESLWKPLLPLSDNSKGTVREYFLDALREELFFSLANAQSFVENAEKFFVKNGLLINGNESHDRKPSIVKYLTQSHNLTIEECRDVAIFCEMSLDIGLAFGAETFVILDQKNTKYYVRFMNSNAENFKHFRNLAMINVLNVIDQNLKQNDVTTIL